MKNYFDILQLPENASHDEIRQAYRQLAKRYHPDVNKSPDAHEKFCEITEAYEFLIHYWPGYISRNTGSGSKGQKYQDHQHTEVYEKFQREAQEKAKHQARMRYEKFQKQHEAFQESGINDIALLLTAIMRVISFFLFVFLVFTPLVLSILAHWSWIFVIFFMWPFAAGIAWYYHDNRKNYFLPGKFFYSPLRIRHLFTDTHPTAQLCYYCKGKPADSKPYRLELLKLKDVRIKTTGYRQHNVNYVNQNYAVMIPRSQKAFIIHSVNILIKVISILACLIFIDISSLIWRIIFGMALGGILARINMILFRTKSNLTYLFSLSLIIRVIFWITGICLASRFYFHPFGIYSTEAIYFVIVVIIIFDSFIMQILSMILGKNSSKPLFSQFPETAFKFSEGYIVYNDVPVISFIYPLFRWIFG